MVWHARMNVMKNTRGAISLGLVALMVMCMSACGDDDEENTGASDTGVEAVAPPPDRAFDGLEAALEGQGLVVAPLPKAELDGAEVGVKITGDKSGSARSFPTEASAKEYAGEVAKSGEKTTIVGTVVFQAATQEDADFFADAYE